MGRASSDGVAVQLTNPTGPLGQTYEIRVTASSNSTGFTSDIEVIDAFRFEQGQTITWQDTRFKGSLSPRSDYIYHVRLRTILGNDAFGPSFKLNTKIFAAALPTKKPEPRPPRPGPPSSPNRGKLGQPEKNPIIYVVKDGDFLIKLAQKFYGDRERWREIYDANISVIGPNPNLIHPGQRLVIPNT